ncbi:MAG TPA: adenylate/guanylate cyclase domain-containing protein [Actinomycetes bacterium]|nr:adenylate/guanylate cyclase domain-containing protein [Actinomycetes bacterium]
MAERADVALLEPYVPRLALTWLRDTPDALWREVDGSLAFVDISGFTALTERLARKGKVGAEEMSDILNATFADLLSVAYPTGAGLVKWGGDAVLLLFEGPDHAARAALASSRMRARLRRIGQLSTGSGRVELRMSVGIHSGAFHFFLVGDPAVHRELIVSGPAASRTAEMEAIAEAGEVVVSPETAALLEASSVGDAKGGGFLLAADPVVEDSEVVPRPSTAGLDLATLIPPNIRAHLLSASGEPEHRRIAVAFVQFSGTDAVLAERGPQALAEALDECVRNVQDATERHGVTFFESDINRDGGKIMLTAGAPVSLGNDEERMLRAARHVVDLVGQLPIRIGVNCGPVFAGDFGPSFRKTFSVKGDAINLAARVMGKAEPGQVLATAAVVEASAARFDAEAMPPFLVKGKSEPVHAFSLGRLLSERRGREDSPFIGREAELGVLREAAEKAAAGSGQLVDLVGEPGIGKSRLVEEMLRDTPARVLTTRCDEFQTATPYWPFRALLGELLDVSEEADEETLVAALVESATRADPSLLPWLPLVGQVLDVDLPSTPEVDALDERFRRSRTEEVVVRLATAVQPGQAVLVFDDVHLMDEASVDLLEQLCLGLAGRPWLVVVTRRDVGEGFRPSPRYPVVEVRPAPLDAAAASSLVMAALADTALAPHDVAALAARANGNPLFLRGLALAAREGASLDALPSTVEALITSQIDRLPPDERTVLRFASVLGMRFDEATLRALLQGHPLPTSRAALRRMSFFIQAEGHGRFHFDHQLLRDTAYEGLPFRLRRELHGRAGEVIEARTSDPDDVAELLSLHYFHAARHDKAWYYARLAGERAAEKYAYVEAEEHLERAVASVRGLRDVPDEQVASAYLSLGEARNRLGRNEAALVALKGARARLKGYPARAALVLKEEAAIQNRLGRQPVALRSVTRGLRLLDGHGDAQSLAARSRLEGVYAVVRENQGRYRDALQWARLAERDAEASGDTAALADALEALHGVTSMLGGEPDRPYGQQALELYEHLGFRAGQSRALNNLAVLAWIQGRGQEALEMFERAQRLAEESGDTVGAAQTGCNVGDVLVRLGRTREAEDILRRLIPTLQGAGVGDFIAVAHRALGLALVLEGQHDEGQAELEGARAMFIEFGEPSEVAETDAAIALGLLGEGRAQEARDLADDAAVRATALDAGYLLPWLLRLQGAAEVDLGDVDIAEETLHRALETADAQGRVECGFILAELARVARMRGDEESARRWDAESEQALDRLGFAGSRRYPRRPGPLEI